MSNQVSKAITWKEESSAPQKEFTCYNQVSLSGKIENEFEYSHTASQEKFYRSRICSRRLDGKEDFIPIIVSKSLIKKQNPKNLKNTWVEVTGEFRSRDKTDNTGHSHLELFLFVLKIVFYEKQENTDVNAICLDGYICKPPEFIKTHNGTPLTNLLIALNHPLGKSDYIPCIAFGKKAKSASKFVVGDKISIYGSIISKRFFKRYSEYSEEGEYREAYQVYVESIKLIE